MLGLLADLEPHSGGRGSTLQRLGRLGVVLAIIIAPATALAAEPSAGDKETSRALFAQGMQALDAHDYAGAERACGGVVKIVNVPPGEVCWAKALEGLGRLLEARDAYLAAAHYPSKADEPAVFTSARNDGQASADRLEGRIASLVLDVSGTKDGASLRVTIDNVEIPPDVARLPRRVDPGRHLILVTSPGYRTARLEVATTEGQEARVRVMLLPGESGSEGVTPPAPSAPGSSRVPAFVAFGVGGAGLVLGSIFGAMALGDAGNLRSQSGCPSNCPTSAQPQIGSLHAAQWISDIGLGLGVVGLGVGAALWFTSHGPEAPPTASLRVDVGPGVVGLHGGF
jgi:hypothetical protein